MIEEAQEGNVVIDGDPFNIAFNTIMPGKELIKDENLPILNIKNVEEFWELLNEYLNTKLEDKLEVNNKIMEDTFKKNI